MRSTPLLTPALLALRSAAATPNAAADVSPRQVGQDAPCSSLHVFLARGNNEPYPGRQEKLIAAICSGLASDECDYEDIRFYNPLPAPYCGSVTEGQASGVRQITEYSERCPDAKIVVSGFSQGGHVVGDVLGGGGGVFFQDCVQEESEGLDADSEPGRKIVAALIFADTRHTADQPYNVLSGAGSDGLFPRSERQTTNLAAYGDRLRDYCAGTDPICAQGDVVDDHLNYFDIYSDDAAAWVHEMVDRAGEDGETTSTTRTTSSTRSTTSVEETTTTESSEVSTSTEEETTTTASSSEASSSEEEETTTTASSSEASSSEEETTTTTTTPTSTTSETTVSSTEVSSTGASQSSETESAAESSATNGSDSDGGAASTGFNVAVMLGLAVGVVAMIM